MVRSLALLAVLAVGAALFARRPSSVLADADKNVVGRQQLVYQAQTSLANGVRVGIFLPSVPVALGLQSMRGPKILAIGDVLLCKPFDEASPVFRKTASGELEALTGHQQLLNCGPLTAGGEDRIFAVAGIQWRQ